VLADLIVMAPPAEQLMLMADVVANLGGMVLEKSQEADPNSPRRSGTEGPRRYSNVRHPSNANDFGESGFASLNSPARVTYTQHSTRKLLNGRPKLQKIHNLRCMTKANQRKFVGWVRDNSRPIQPGSVPPGAGPDRD
jgi:hypothetical protein